MDKYEFNIKVEQMRKLVNKSDYETAMKIADTIDWKKVRNANLLSMVATIYEKNGEYQDAKDILLLAFERAPISKRLLYKLTDLALKSGDVEEADAYYREFCDLAGDDSRQYLLRYKLLRGMDAPLQQQIHALERYTMEELDEKWLYELAELYRKAGDEKKCISTCDRIMLMFGLGKYVDKAMEMKLQFAPLNQYQQDLAENREKYEEKLREVEQSFEEDSDEPVDDGTFPESDALAKPRENRAEEILGDEEEALQEQPVVRQEAPEPKSREAEPQIQESREPEPQVQEPVLSVSYEKEDLEAAVKQAETEEKLAKEMSRLGDVPVKEDSALGKTRVLSELKRTANQTVSQDTKVIEWKDDARASKQSGLVVEEIADSGDSVRPVLTRHLMIEARTPERGLDRAVRMLKQIHKETGVRNPVVKITGSRMNKRGIFASIDKLSGKDLVIEEAGDLNQETLKELEKLMAQDASGMRILLIDNPKQMSMLHEQNPSLADKFEWIVCEQQDAARMSGESPKAKKEEPSAKSKQPQAETTGTAARREPEPVPESVALPEDDRPVRRVVPVHDGAMRAPDPEPDYPSAQVREPADNEEMDIDEFAQYCCKYASEIDCSITGKSMLALYERIEILEEDGIRLTKESAEDLIEEAADRAEKPSIGRRIKGLFSSKYDKDGLLILKEEHFIS
ncbi:MAG: hypothetical protein LUE86_12025 [Clostridiales bacterium]|nr:hypothetical protein [Clostridiales bacterium]